MTAPEREALVKALRSITYDSDRIHVASVLTRAADMIEALSPAVTVTDKMVVAAMKAPGRASLGPIQARKILEAALKSPTPQTAGREE